jgi:hypothetical protein
MSRGTGQMGLRFRGIQTVGGSITEITDGRTARSATVFGHLAGAECLAMRLRDHISRFRELAGGGQRTNMDKKTGRETEVRGDDLRRMRQRDDNWRRHSGAPGGRWDRVDSSLRDFSGRRGRTD